MGRRARRLAAGAACALALASCAAPGPGPTKPAAGGGGHGYLAYFDFNEEEDFLATAPPARGRLIPPWDPNGQLCLANDASGRFAVAFNPTLPGQHNPGSAKPVKQPPVGEAIYDRYGHFTGKTVYVPGPFHLPGQTVGGDIPPDAGTGHFNNNGTYTGCAFDSADNLFATDLGTAQGQFPTPDDGRLIEWFAPSHSHYCILIGPTSGGVGPHHVDGTGGLRQPGLLAFDPHGDLLVPEAGYELGGAPAGRVLKLDHRSLPRGPGACGPDGLYPSSELRYQVFVQGSLARLPFPLAVARDPTCGCWAVDSVFGDPAIAWFDDSGRPLPDRPPVPGEPLSELGAPGGYNPFGMAFAPDGTLYFVDIHIACTNGVLADCGPTPKAGRLMRVRFAGGRPSAPVAVASGLDFPTSVTVCVPAHRTCPAPPRGR
ncbi:MAG TPA: hypothetical protein VKY15_01725 [Acidimicrobiales bacterium]|nr:hypothetical protein [Acidimicrobiales bacterium]